MGPLLRRFRGVCHCYVAPQPETDQSSFPAEGCHRVPISYLPSTLIRALHPSAERGAKSGYGCPQRVSHPPWLQALHLSACERGSGSEYGWLQLVSHPPWLQVRPEAALSPLYFGDTCNP